MAVGSWVLAATAGLSSALGTGPRGLPWLFLSSLSSPSAWSQLTARHSLTQTHLPVGVPPGEAGPIFGVALGLVCMLVWGVIRKLWSAFPRSWLRPDSLSVSL